MTDIAEKLSAKYSSFNGKDIIAAGYSHGPIVGVALREANAAVNNGMDVDVVRSIISALPTKYADFIDDPQFRLTAALWQEIHFKPPVKSYEFKANTEFPIWGREFIDDATVAQMQTAMELPISVAGALNADGHLGYGLPIGGVLATEGAVIPWGVGVDIACRMKISIIEHLDFSKYHDRLRTAVHNNTIFGTGGCWYGGLRQKHDVMDRPDWNILDVIKPNMKDKAWEQLGTSGSGNHFCDIGELNVTNGQIGNVRIPEGKYIAILTHSGSRGTGATVASYYSKLAQSLHPDLPDKYRQLAWLDMDKEGAEYWAAMELMGAYAAANHDVIHREIMKELGITPVAQFENHHNYLWRETYNGRELLVHRKGATPAGKGVVGIIPGSMSTPAYIVVGKGNEKSLNSSSHGAGRTMSRTKAKEKFQGQFASIKADMEARGITLMSAGLDEVAGSYKNIDDVMAAQTDLVDIVGVFHPKIVKMSDDGTSED